MVYNIYIYDVISENNGPSYLSPQWLCGNSCTWSHEDMKNIFNIDNKYCRPSDDWVTPI